MEAIAAFSLACNVIQVIDGAKTTAETIRQIYKHGTSLDNAHIEDKTRNLQALNLKPDPTYPELNKIAQSCESIATELVNELMQLKSSPQRGALKTTIRAIRKRNHIEKLEARLADHERTFNTGLLIRLREQGDATAVTRSSNFRTLDTTLQLFIANLAKGNTQLENVLKAEAQTIKDHVSKEHVETRATVDHARLASVTDQQRQKFLGSLKHPLMNARRNQISSQYPETFEWIFESDHRWSSFPEWLTRDDEIYFIEGKAASGKSTLMKFVVEDKRTKEYLRTWHESVQMISHFFWLAGDPIQRNLRGLAATLVHQVLDNDSEALKTHVDPAKDNPMDWSLVELLKLLGEVTKTGYFCIFIDGLDEFEGDDPQELFDLIQVLAARPNLKLCVSSRPDLFYVRELQQSSKILLQDLTNTDIEIYVASRIKEAQKRGQLQTTLNKDRIIQEIIPRAQGVFLWVHLALNSVLRGLRNFASMTELLVRINSLPESIGQLYQDMLGRHGEDWALLQSEAALYFDICLHTEAYTSRIRPCRLLLAIILNLVQGVKAADFTEHFLLDILRRTKDRVYYVSAGLLECENDSLDLSSEINHHFIESVGFSHRTARDFLIQQPAGQEIMKRCDLTSLQKAKLGVELEIIWCHYEPYFPRGTLSLWGTIANMLIHIGPAIKQDRTNSETSQLLDRICQAIPSIVHCPGNKSQKILEGHRSKANQAGSDLEFGIASYFRDISSMDHEFAAVDYIGLTLECGISTYFHHTVEQFLGKQNGETVLSLEYLDYLLLCASRALPRSHASNIIPVINQLLQAGACPETNFFLPPGYPLRMRAVTYLQHFHSKFNSRKRSGTLESERGLSSGPYIWTNGRGKPYSDWIDMKIQYGSCNMLVDLGTLLDLMKTETIIQKKQAHNEGVRCINAAMYNSIHWSEVVRNGFILRRHRSYYLASREDSHVIATSIRETSSGRHFELSDEEWVRTKVLRAMRKTPWTEIQNEVQEVDPIEWLKERGCYKDPSDPTVLKGPIKRFKDGVDASHIPEW